MASCEGDELGLENLSDYNRERVTLGAFASEFTPRPLQEVLRTQVQGTVRYCRGDLAKAAELLEITPDEVAQYLEGR